MRSQIANRAIAAITVLIVALIAAESFIGALFVVGTRDQTNIYIRILVCITNYTVCLSEKICTSRGLSNSH